MAGHRITIAKMSERILFIYVLSFICDNVPYHNSRSRWQITFLIHANNTYSNRFSSSSIIHINYPLIVQNMKKSRKVKELFSHGLKASTTVNQFKKIYMFKKHLPLKFEKCFSRSRRWLMAAIKNVHPS